MTAGEGPTLRAARKSRRSCACSPASSRCAGPFPWPCQGEGREFESRRPLQEVAGHSGFALRSSPWWRPIRPITGPSTRGPRADHGGVKGSSVSAARAAGSCVSRSAPILILVAGCVAPAPSSGSGAKPNASSTPSSPASPTALLPEPRRRWGSCWHVGSSWSRRAGRQQTVRHTRSALRCQLVLHLGHVQLGDLNAERIDAL